MADEKKIINIAIIAHVDAGKSTLTDGLLNQSGVFRDPKAIDAGVMDTNDQEKERGITIYSKNCSIVYKDIKINIVDTPGHADFSSEVERIMRTVDTAVLLVDASEGPMPQTRFVLSKALELGLKPILMINKIDKKDARPQEVVDEVLELFMELGATDDQLEFPIVYGIAKQGTATTDLAVEGKDLTPLLETIVAQVGSYDTSRAKNPTRMQVSTLAYDSFIGRLGIGRIYDGTLKLGQSVTVITNDGKKYSSKITKLFVYQGLNKVEVTEASAGDIVVAAGAADISIGDTIAANPDVEPLPSITIEEPTMSMNFLVNTSPFAGQSGKLLTSRNIQDRLEKETEVNVGMKWEPLKNSDIEGFKVLGRGELHLSVLIEAMRREGFELAISKPEVVFHKDPKTGKIMEPMQKAIIDVPTEYSGTVIKKLNARKGKMIDMDSDGTRDKVTYNIPMRALIGFRSEFTNDTHGEGIMVKSPAGFEEYAGEIQGRANGVMVSMSTGVTVAYSLGKLEARGTLFVGAGVDVYEGMIIGQHSRDNDLDVNPTTGKKLTNTRSSGTDESVKLTPAKVMNLEESLEYIENDELVECTPTDIRLRKRYLTDNERKKHRNAKKQAIEVEY